MKLVILAGGQGTRLAEATEVRPKPMVEIGDQPILWHIMKHAAFYGVSEFVVALGYKGDVIKQYFLDYARVNCSLTVDVASGEVAQHSACIDDWRVHLVDTGATTETGGRLKRLGALIGDEPFIMTYGDGLADVDLVKLMRFHERHEKLATVTAVRPPARFGRLEFEGNRVASFSEKSQLEEGWINGGYFVLNPGVLEYIAGDDTSWERHPMERLAGDGELMAYRHPRFWQCMDTLRDQRLLESLWRRGHAPWKVWSS